MLIKTVTLFLLAMVVIAMIGKLLFPGAIGRSLKDRIAPRAAVCKSCGRHVIGKTACDCKKV